MFRRGLLLVTGSREEFCRERTADGLQVGLARLRCEETWVIHGRAPGLDRTAEEVAQENELPTRGFAANWDRDGKAAGSLRNQEMVDWCRLMLHLRWAQAVVCVAFPLANSVGTWDCVKRAHRARFGVWIQPC